jgi:hypothetical protein
MNVVIGSDRLWCPETVNGVVGVCAELAIAFGHSHTFVWRLPGGEPLATWPRLAELRDATSVTLVGDDVIVEAGGRRWSVALATGDARVVGHAPVVAKRAEPGAVSADGRWRIVGDLSRSRLRVFDQVTGVELTPDEPDFASDAIATCDGVVVADGAAGGAAAWDLSTRARIARLDGVEYGLCARGGAICASTNAGVARWAARTGERLAFAALPGKVQSGSFDRDGRRFAGTLYRLPGGLMYDALPGLWLADLDTGRVEKIDAPVDYMRTVALAPDGDRFVTASDAELRVWDRTGSSRVIGAVEEQTSLIFAPDGAAIWTGRIVPLDGGAPQDVAVTGEVLRWIDAGLLVAAGFALRLVGLSGDVRATWTFAEPVTAASVDDGLLAVATRDGRLHVQAFAW